MRSQGQTTIFTAFPSCSLEHVGAQGSGSAVLPIILVPILPRGIEHMRNGQRRGFLGALLTLVSAFNLIIVLSNFYLYSALQFPATWPCSAPSFHSFHRELLIAILDPFSAFFLCSLSPLEQ